MQPQKAKTDETVLGFEVTLEDLGKETRFPSKLDTPKLKLDIGCGSSKKGAFLGVDLVKTTATDVVADSTSLPIKDGCFEYVYSRRCIQHIKDDTQALKEIYRVLKLYGKLELIVASFYGYLFYKFRSSESSGKYAVFHLYLKRKLRKLLKAAGFLTVNISKVKSVRKIGYDFIAICEKLKRKPYATCLDFGIKILSNYV
ncbi:class I SAM-dependent methyltransferase [Candidatus Bathyarchaeota archaeon]|nr:class I SAM-dependent methyltransferase [Candidatus Bathyarchaeota archaeon]